jgi:transposase-like protein
MARACTICTHEQRTAIEAAVIEGGSYRGIARRFSVGSESLRRHVKAGHLPGRAIARASVVLSRAEADGRDALVLQSVRELRAILDSAARIAAAVDRNEPIVVNLSFDDGRPFPPQPLLPGEAL